AVTFPDPVVEPLLQVLLGDRLARQLVPQVRNDRVANEQLERQLMDLRAAAHVVFGCIHVAAGMQAHVHAAHSAPPGASCSLSTSISNCMSFVNPAGVRMAKFFGSSSRLMSTIFRNSMDIGPLLESRFAICEQPRDSPLHIRFAPMGPNFC